MTDSSPSRAVMQPSKLHERIIGELRRYSAVSIVDAAMRLLWTEYPNKMEALQAAPWHILLLVKWALRDEHVRIRIGPRITAAQFDELRQAVQDLVGQEYLANKPPVFLMLRAHMPQFDFQRPEGWGFLRWPALIAREAASQPTRRQFIENLGLPPEHFMDLTFGLMAATLERKFPLSAKWFEQVRPAYGSSIDAFWRLVARDLPSLRHSLQTDAKAQRQPLRQELYEFPYLKRYPFFKSRGGDYFPWHPMVVARGLEEIVHWRLAALQEDYTRPFSRLFERYVWELAQEMSARTVTEKEYERAVGGEASKVEAIIPCDDCTVLVEAKMALFADDVLLTDNETQAFQKTKRVRDAIKQAWNVGKALRLPDSAVPACAAAQQDFLLLVTSRELGLGSGDKLLRLYPAGYFNYPDEECRHNLPLENVFILPIQDFERLSTAVAHGAICLPDLLKEAVKKNRDPATSAILFDMFMGPYVRSWGSPKLLLEARSASSNRLGQAAGETEEERSADDD